MCRNIKTLSNFEPPATQEEIRAASLQFARKVSGFSKPSRINEQVFEEAVSDISRCVETLLQSLEIKSPPRNRDEVKKKLLASATLRRASSFGSVREN